MLGNDETREAWADLMYFESTAMLNAMRYLMSQGIPSLSVHDALIVPVSGRERGEFAIKTAYHGACGAQPILKTLIAQPLADQ